VLITLVSFVICGWEISSHVMGRLSSSSSSLPLPFILSLDRYTCIEDLILCKETLLYPEFSNISDFSSNEVKIRCACEVGACGSVVVGVVSSALYICMWSQKSVALEKEYQCQSLCKQ
jgi:hypothetical protein